MTGSIGAVVVGAAATAGLSAGFPRPPPPDHPALSTSRPRSAWRRSTGARPPSSSWDWEANRGTVRLDGSLWNATATVPVREGDEVLVVGHERMELRIIPGAPVVRALQQKELPWRPS